jgi:plasmid stabilization system protein ParE
LTESANYLKSIEAALNLLREDPSLLKAKPEFSPSLSFYRVRQHFLVCATFEEQIFVLTVKHGAMDLPNRIAEIEPQLHREAMLLHAAYLKKQGMDAA